MIPIITDCPMITSVADCIGTALLHNLSEVNDAAYISLEV